MSGRGTSVAGTVLLAGPLLALGACSTDGPEASPPRASHRPVATSAYDPARDTSVYGHARSAGVFDALPRWRPLFEQVVRLDDGRRVRVWYSRSGDALKEQHYSPRARSWTAPRVLHRSAEPDPCQGIRLEAAGDLVALSADFATYCYDGEPPEEAVAAVSFGDLTDWRVDARDARSASGWTEVTVDGDRVTWRGVPGAALTWTPSEGFAG